MADERRNPTEGRAVPAGEPGPVIARLTLFAHGNDFERANVQNFEAQCDEIKSAKNRPGYERRLKTRREARVVLQALLVEFQGPGKGR